MIIVFEQIYFTFLNMTSIVANVNIFYTSSILTT